jgi:hypothetical protein
MTAGPDRLLRPMQDKRWIQAAAWTWSEERCLASSASDAGHH